mmetsp:Transcript_94358/g.290880  ORF Transcript_94358/g.290880 Transcript_94358/m.290880 type:complete len:245 (+) Transcript_94358:473-1207(+)
MLVAVYEVLRLQRLPCRRLARWVAGARRRACGAMARLREDDAWASGPAYSGALVAVETASLGARHTSRLLAELGLAGRACPQRAADLQGALAEDARVYGARSGGTACSVLYEFAGGPPPACRVFHSSGKAPAPASPREGGPRLVAVGLRTSRHGDAEFLALGHVLQEALRSCRRQAAGAAGGTPLKTIDVLRLLELRVWMHVSRIPCLSCIGAMVQLQAMGASLAVSFDEGDRLLMELASQGAG